MLPPLQPEYNLQGDLETMAYFNAVSMNERSGRYTDPKALENNHAVVRLVLFPLVVKQEEGNEQEIIYQAQALIAGGDDSSNTKPSAAGKKNARIMSTQGGNKSAQSFAPSTMGEGGMF